MGARVVFPVPVPVHARKSVPLDQHDRGGVTVILLGVLCLVGVLLYAPRLGTVADTTSAPTTETSSCGDSWERLVATGTYSEDMRPCWGPESGRMVQTAIRMHSHK